MSVPGTEDDAVGCMNEEREGTGAKSLVLKELKIDSILNMKILSQTWMMKTPEMTTFKLLPRFKLTVKKVCWNRRQW